MYGVASVRPSEFSGVMWTHEDALDLARTLRRLREQRELSQEYLAFPAGITKNQMQLLEAARGSWKSGTDSYSNPKLATLKGLADALGITVAELMAEAGL